MGMAASPRLLFECRPFANLPWVESVCSVASFPTDLSGVLHTSEEIAYFTAMGQEATRATVPAPPTYAVSRGPHEALDHKRGSNMSWGNRLAQLCSIRCSTHSLTSCGESVTILRRL